MNVRPSFYAGIGTGIMASAALLGIIQWYGIQKSGLDVAAMNDQIHSLRNWNQQLHQQLRLAEQKAITQAQQKTDSKITSGKNLTTKHKNGTLKAGFVKPAGNLVTVVIYPGMSISEIATVLTASGIIPSPGPFIIDAIKYNQPLRAGKFTFNVNEPYSRILYIMATN